MMMIHNAYMVTCGNAAELRKAADDLDAINKGNRQAYLQKARDKLTEEALVAMLDAETWLTAEECIRYGLADEYAERDADMSQAAAVLQRTALNLEQRIHLHKALAAQLRELARPVLPPAPAVPEAAGDVSNLDTTPDSGEDTAPSVMEALRNMFKIRKDGNER